MPNHIKDVFHDRLPARFGFEFVAEIFDMKTPYTIDMMIPTPNVDSSVPIATGCSHFSMISLGPTNCNGAAVVVVVVDVVVEVATDTNTSHLTHSFRTVLLDVVDVVTEVVVVRIVELVPVPIMKNTEVTSSHKSR